MNNYINSENMKRDLGDGEGDEDNADPREYDDPLMNEILTIFCHPERADEAIFRERGIDFHNSLVRRTIWSTITCLKVRNLIFTLSIETKLFLHGK